VDIIRLAARARGFFESQSHPRPGLDPVVLWHMKKRRPVWVKDMVYHVHEAGGKMGPDNFKYETIVDVLDRLSDGQDPEEPDLEADVYTHDLLAWLASNLERSGYVDEAVEQLGHSEQGVIGDITQGQWYEKEEIWRLVVDALNSRLEAIDLGEPEDMEIQGTPEKRSPKDWHPAPPGSE
jgi:hypothetical protein